MLATAWWRRWGGWVMGVIVALVGLAVLWFLLAGTASTKREVAATAMVMLPPPPPPPPEPEKLPEPEPEKIEPKITEIEPTPVESMDKPMDDAAPSPSQDMGDPMTMNADAQAGTDGIAVGAGGGMTGGGGGGLGAGSYQRYISARLQQALTRDPRTRNLVFSDLRVDLWMAADGRVTKVQLAQGSSNDKTDELVLAMLREIQAVDERPPASMRFPMRVSMNGRRP
ncbi:MAG: TonB C-terminal domain-containing protein [Acidovorax sp.]|nr:TonB C-terminal domain-containing protein [Acidovorax sp.]